MSAPLLRAALATAVLIALPTPAASADGLPVGGIDAGPNGVTVRASTARYVTVGVGAHRTLVGAIERTSGRLRRWRIVDSALTLPAVALDGSPSGLSADGRTLVLLRPRISFPQRSTRLVALDAHRLVVRRVIDLRGDYSFDAIAPDGRSLYLIHYRSRTDPNQYEVRRYDVAAHRLDAAPIVDPHERGERMAGLPLSRAMSPDGRWAFTLYDGGGGEPFIHALDTRAARARCIDMPPLARVQDLWTLRLRLTGRRLTVTDGRRRALAVIDTRTLRPPAAVPRGTAPAQHLPWWLIGVAAALLAAAAATARSARRRSPRPRPPRRPSTRQAGQRGPSSATTPRRPHRPSPRSQAG